LIMAWTNIPVSLTGEGVLPRSMRIIHERRGMQ
jgi:hypothetical protein